MLNTRVVVAALIYNFVVDKFFICSYLDSEVFVLNSHIFQFKILNFFKLSRTETRPILKL